MSDSTLKLRLGKMNKSVFRSFGEPTHYWEKKILQVGGSVPILDMSDKGQRRTYFRHV